MRYIKSWKLFENQSFKTIIDDITKKANENGVKLLLPETNTVPYVTGSEVSGYFVDNGNPILACAIGGDIKRWGPILAHESSHMDQWIENCSAWTNNYYKGREAVDWLDEWCQDKVKFSDAEVDDLIERAIGVELDCEKRTIEKEKKYNLPVNIEEEIQKSISYILFYRFLKESKKWNSPGKAPYLIKEIWSLMPKSFDEIDFKTVPENIKEAYYKYCY
jgi:hypothetical protein